MLLTLLACAVGPSGGADTGWGDVHLAAARAACIDAHGYGIDDPEELERLARSCEGDACDPDRYLSEPAVACIARACGLEEGLDGIRTSLEYAEGGPDWLASNLLVDCGPELCSAGEFVMIDGTTGACLGRGVWQS